MDTVLATAPVLYKKYIDTTYCTLKPKLILRSNAYDNLSHPVIIIIIIIISPSLEELLPSCAAFPPLLYFLEFLFFGASSSSIVVRRVEELERLGSVVVQAVVHPGFFPLELDLLTRDVVVAPLILVAAVAI